ncbi:hypothetical protein ACNS7O_07095 [Haloferacaceae archaeon DSL9]
MRIQIGDEIRYGTGIDLSDSPVTDTDVREGIRGESSLLTVDCASPGPGYDRLALVRPGSAVAVRTVLAAAARSRGRVSSRDNRLAEVTAELEAIEAPTVETSAIRRRLATVGEAEREQAERVELLRGRLAERRTLNLDTREAKAALRGAVAKLSEVQLDRLDAEETLERAERRARRARTERDRRLALEDKIANERRAARAELAASLYDEFRDAVAELPGTAQPGSEPAAYAGETTVAQLGAIAVASLSAPVVLSTNPFDRVEDAVDRLDAPVIVVEALESG